MPRGWMQGNTPDVDVTFNSPDGAVSAIVLEKVSGLTDLDDLQRAAEKELKRKHAANYAQVSFDKVVIDGRRAYKRVYNRLNSSGEPIRAVQIYLIADNTAHILQFAAATEDYARQAPTFDGIADSYKIGR